MDDKKNYWAEVAKVFGVELGEEFNIIGSEGKIHAYSPYRFTENGFRDGMGNYSISVLVRLINGDYIIDKLPWKPKEGDRYWYVAVGSDGIARISDDTWDNYSVDMLNYKSGNCFRTKEKAEQNKDKIVTMLKSDKVFEY